MDLMTDIEFKVNEQYENEKGVFTVVSMHKDEMVIKWESGEEIRTSIDLQRRIQERRLLDEWIKENKLKSSRGGRKAAGKNSVFNGFQLSDFKNSATGTKWRGRSQLGGAVSHRMPDTRFNFNSWAFGHKPEMHWFDTEHRSKDHNEYQAKFFARVDLESLFYGFYVTRPEPSVENNKDWHNLFEWLKHEDNDKLLQDRMNQHQLMIQDRSQPSLGIIVPEKDKWNITSGDQPKEADRLLPHIESLPADDVIELEIMRKVDKEEAVAKEAQIVEDMAELFAELMFLYQAVIKI